MKITPRLMADGRLVCDGCERCEAEGEGPHTLLCDVCGEPATTWFEHDALFEFLCTEDYHCCVAELMETTVKEVA
jgi:hypothetical protein